MKQEILALDRVTIFHEDTPVLNNVSLHIFAGEITGLLCVNSQGVDEFLDLISFNTPIHYGYVYFMGEIVHSYRRSLSQRNPVSIIEKQSRLVDDLTVADNIFVLRKNFHSYVLNKNMMEGQLEPYLKDLESMGVRIPVSAVVSSLSLLQRWALELLKAVVSGVKLVVIRDITNYVNTIDLHKIHALMKHYAAQGMAFIYMCNHHQEIFSISDKTAVMLDGTIQKILMKDQMNEDVMTHFSQSFRTAVNDSHRKFVAVDAAEHQDSLICRDLYSGNLKNISFTMRAGECVVFMDIDGTAVETFMGLCRGTLKSESGTLTIAGKEPSPYDRNTAIIQERPTKNMIFPDMSYIDNLCFLVDNKVPRFWSNPHVKESIIKEYLPLIGPTIFAPSLHGLPEKALYDLVYCRTLLQSPELVVCMQPFFGVDMYQRVRIIEFLDTYRRKGISVLILALSLSDSLEVADRLLIIQNGSIVESYDRKDFSSVKLISGSRPTL
ncbi:ATP-binding cassette domain-containing protein [Parasphaerochaeta coccoides]|uniref:Monosaccharide-transporting ATPase n=1 Tax=Parasphaerochaeta coccoides (strain ATCC BAA-1237 / DSM 17374 / SPN1) TaxID=760011 RepID=F4GJS8_PARC1|nr:sugar ABC transporter ATP-binding protein [Parasphaerochaeta coccoides]AEC02825.1 monosaccharide-transporting ATPase [Parasphaerochaeta coccoides DSM 17374]